MQEPERVLILRIIEIARDTLDAIANELRSAQVAPETSKVVPVQRRIALYMAIEAAGPSGIGHSDLRKAALKAGYASLADTKVYYRKVGTPHLKKVADYRTVLTEAGRAWLKKKTAGSAA